MHGGVYNPVHDLHINLVRPHHTIMKKNRIIIWSIITLFTVIVALMAFDLHASFDVGHRSVRWDGLRYFGLAKTFGSTEGASLINGRLEKFSVYMLGPISVSSRQD